MRICHYTYVSDKSCADFSLKMHQKSGPVVGAYSALPDILAGFKGCAQGQEKGEGEEQEGMGRRTGGKD